MDHLHDSDSCAELSRKLLRNLTAQFVYFEPFLRTDRKVRLVLIKRNVQDLLFLLLHSWMSKSNIIIKSSDLHYNNHLDQTLYYKKRKDMGQVQ